MSGRFTARIDLEAAEGQRSYYPASALAAISNTTLAQKKAYRERRFRGSSCLPLPLREGWGEGLTCAFGVN